MVHKLIKREVTEFIEPKDDEDVKKILGQTEKKKDEDEEGDIMDDYDAGMGEFLDSMEGKVEPAKKKTSEIRALGD